MDILEKILDRVDRMDHKLDKVSEQVVEYKTKQNHLQGQVKWIYTLFLTGATGMIHYIWKQITNQP